MKSLLVSLFFLLSFITTAQTEDGWGFTGGLNYAAIGDLIQGAETVVENPESNFGFHAGLFSKYDLGPINLRVEFLYTDISSGYLEKDFKLKKFDLPVHAGISIVGPFEFFIGPAAQYIITADIDDIDISEIEDRFTVGAQVGFSFNLGNLGFDLRYERGLTKSEFNFSRDLFGISSGVSEAIRLDSRPEQFILSASVKI